jgi:hypothetical protein
MTELARIQPATNSLAHRAPNLPQPAAGVTALQVWVETAQAAGQLVASIVDTPFFPAALWPKQVSTDPEKEAARRAQAIANGTGALIYGAELGLTPMNALTEVFVVHGRPSIYANTMVALLQAAGHEIWTESISDTSCTVHGRRAGSTHVEPVTFTIADAKRAGYVAKNQKYVTDPQAMLYARAASICCKRVAPEVLKGIPSFEEVQDDPRVQHAEAPPVRQAPVTAAELVAAPTPAAEPAGNGRDRMLRSILATLDHLGVTGKDAMRRVVAALAGRPIGSAAELTAEELAQVDNALDQMVDAGDAGRAEAAFLAADPAEPAAPDDDPPPEPAEGRMTRGQQGRLFAALGAVGVDPKDRDARLQLATGILRRDVRSYSDLTEDEAHDLIDALALYAEQGDDGRAQIAAMTRKDPS